MAKTEDAVDNEGRFWGSIAAGLILGFVIGGTMGLLYAPKEGRELRGDIEDAADKLKGQTEATLDDIQESALRIAERSRALLEETRENIVRSVEAGREAYEQKRVELTTQLETQLRGETNESETTASGV